jgi:glycosyltransferase involved in cell wall biosynthesis
MNKLNLTYVFGSGRKNKLLNNKYKAREFFYGIDYFIEQNKEIRIIEMSQEKLTVYGFKKIVRLFDKALRKLTNLPFYFTEILTFEHFKILRKTDKLLITNDRLAISLLPFLLVIKIIKNIDINVIVMGLFSKKNGNFIVKFLQNIFIKLLIILSNNFIFLGLGEINLAEDRFSKFSKKFKFLPFSIDTEFWGEKKIDIALNNQILFIGNDGNRDYELFIKIVESLPEYSFVCISNNLSNSKLPPNCKLITGNWNDSLLSDEEIRDYYLNSRIVIIPLKETFQPSGQSVTLQSMSVGVPVFISKTSGFWDNSKFSDNENIIFLKENSIQEWVEKIKGTYENLFLLKSISDNAKKEIHTNLNLNKFNTKLKEILNIM